MCKEDLGLIWMSAGNSYFKEDIIEKIIKSSLKKFKEIIVISPSEPAKYNFLAKGLPENKAKRKAKLNANLLLNRAKRIKENKLTKEEKERIKIIYWTKKIKKNSFYKEEYSEIKRLYNKNKKFKRIANKTTEKILFNRPKNINLTINYLIEELSFILASPKIYNAKKVTYIYHHKFPIYQRLIEGKYNNMKKKNLGFLLLRINKKE